MTLEDLFYTQYIALIFEYIRDVLGEFRDAFGFELFVGLDYVLSVLGLFFSFEVAGRGAFFDDVFGGF